jgi:hypothetical protein
MRAMYKELRSIVLAAPVVCGALAWGCSCPDVRIGPPVGLRVASAEGRVDPNGFPVNPVFVGGQSPVEPRNCDRFEDCGAASETLPSPRKAWIPLLCRDSRPGRGKERAGHWNYSVATFTGKVAWDGYSPDDDYGLTLLVPASGADSILTCGSEQGVHVEFRASETVNHFRTPWWRTLQEAVRSGQENRTASDYLGKKAGLEAVLVGLVGIDMVHCFATELHPVYGFAAMVDGEAGKEERWALFARLVGGEGECGEGSSAPALEFAPKGRLVLPLPWRRDKAGKLLPPPFLGESTAILATEGSDLTSADEVIVRPSAESGWVTVSIPVAPLTAGDENARAWTRVSGELVLRYASSGLELVESEASVRGVRPGPATDSAAYFREISSRKEKEEKLVKSLKKLNDEDRKKVLEAIYQSVVRANAGPDDEKPLTVRRVISPPALAEAIEVPWETPPAAGAPAAAPGAKASAVKKIPNPWYVDPD